MQWLQMDDEGSSTGAPALGDRKMIVSAVLTLIRRNELAEAGIRVEQVLAKCPDDPVFLHLLGTVRRLERRAAEAELLYRRSLAINASQPAVHRDLGKMLTALGRIDEAIAALREAIRLTPDDADAHFGLAAALARNRDHAAAETAYHEALRLQPEHPLARLGLGETLMALGCASDAERLLREAPSTSLRNPPLAAAHAHQLGVAMQQQKKFGDALAQFDRAQAIAPEYPAVDFSRGETLQQLGRLEEAAESFRRVLARQPGHMKAAASLALIRAIHNEPAEAREWSMKVLARAPMHPLARIALAIVDIEAGACSAAEQTLRHVLENPEHGAEVGTAFASHFASEAFDRHGRHRAAFAVARASKAVLRGRWPVPQRRMVDVARDLSAHLDRMEPWSSRPEPPRNAGEPRAHAFVLGFLRSGTTVLETILATDPDVVHADEVDFLGGTAGEFLTDSTGLHRLAALDEGEIEAWRRGYWTAVRDAGFSAEGKIFLDKMPINTLRLPLIARLFPSAKIVFAFRDPRDVVLSCFRHHFDLTPYSYELLTLEDCARFYMATMSFADVCRRKLSLHFFEHRYEAVAENFDSSIRAVCGFIGMPWRDDMRAFERAAGAIDFRSASARQVRRGLYAGAAGHWRHYRDDLAPVLPLLAPWVAHFGYPPE